MSENEPTYGYGVTKMDVHKETCEANPMDRDWVIFTPPDCVIPSCPKCHDVIFGATCILDGDEEHIVHPCHHVLTHDETAGMLTSAVKL